MAGVHMCHMSHKILRGAKLVLDVHGTTIRAALHFVVDSKTKQFWAISGQLQPPRSCQRVLQGCTPSKQRQWVGACQHHFKVRHNYAAWLLCPLLSCLGLHNILVAGVVGHSAPPRQIIHRAPEAMLECLFRDVCSSLTRFYEPYCSHIISAHHWLQDVQEGTRCSILMLKQCLLA